MLIQFTIENHRSIRNSAVVSFTASKDKSLDEYLLHPDEKRRYCLRLRFMARMPREKVMSCMQ